MLDLTGGPYILARLKQLRAANKSVKLVRYYEVPPMGTRNTFGDTDPNRAAYRYLNNKSISRLQGPAIEVDLLIERGLLTKRGQLKRQEKANG